MSRNLESNLFLIYWKLAFMCNLLDFLLVELEE